MPTDTTEHGLEALICTTLTGSSCDPDVAPAGETYERPAAYGTGWVCGDPAAYDREYCVDLAQLALFLRATQPDMAETLDLAADGPTRHKFLTRLQGEINKLFSTRSAMSSAAGSLRSSLTRRIPVRAARPLRPCQRRSWKLGTTTTPLRYKINRLMEERRLLPNASYFAFTATPKNKTLEIFGAAVPEADGAVKHLPFHTYTMKQAIEEGFILDVLASYTPVQSYYHLAKTVADDPEFDANKAQKKLRRYVESHDYAIRLKAEIMVDHFHEQVLTPGKVGGQARAMVVTSGVERAIQYYEAIKSYLAERKSPHRAIIAFSGEREYGGAQVSEASLNGFPPSQIAEKIREEPYRFLVCADKFQTGYDEPLLHAMYVDKILSGIKAVQTLSRLNRAHPKKYDVFILDFANDADTIREAFEPYYRTTILADETDPNKLHDLQTDLDDYQVYAPEHVDDLVNRYLQGEPRDRLDPILDMCVEAYREELDESGQVDFKGKAKAFIRTYGFLSMVLPYANAEWEKRAIFLNLLVPKLPAPREEDMSRGILEAIDMDSYRVEKQLTMSIQLPDDDGGIEPVPVAGGGGKSDPELERLSNIVKAFNERFGNIPWEDADRVHRLITEDIPARVGADEKYRNARENSDRQNARIELDKAVSRVMNSMINDDTQLFRKFADDEGFKRWLTDAVFDLTYK